MEFEKLVSMMQSSDYKERFKAEYIQLKDRHEKLSRMIDKYRAGTLPFTPSCPIGLLERQAHFMAMYLYILEKRAELENIEL